MTRHPSIEKNTPTYCREFALSGSYYCSIILLLLSLLLSSPVSAAPPQAFVIHNPRIITTQHQLVASLSVSVDDEDGLRNMLKDGALLALGISATIKRVRSWWGNEEIFTSESISTILHDPLTRDFLINLPELEGKSVPHRDKNLTRLLHATWRKLSIPLVSIERLTEDEPGSQYEITLNLSLQHNEVPPWLEKSLVFWSSNIVPQEKITLQYALPEASPETAQEISPEISPE